MFDPKTDLSYQPPLIESGHKGGRWLLRVVVLTVLLYGGWQVVGPENLNSALQMLDEIDISSPIDMPGDVPRKKQQQAEKNRLAAAQRAATELALSLPVPIEMALQPALNLYADATEVDLGPDAQVVVTSKYSVMRYGQGDPNNRQLLLNPQIYTTQFPEQKFQAIASSLALPDHRYVFGGWHGEVLSLVDGKLRRHSERQNAPKGRITDLIYWRGMILVAGDGLWRLNLEMNRISEIAEFHGNHVRSMGKIGDDLLVATSRRIWRYDGSRISLWSSEISAGQHVNRLRERKDGSIWAATRDGLLQFDSQGKITQQLLAGIWTTDVIETDEALWVATWKQGLLLLQDQQWYRYTPAEGLAGPSISAVEVDTQGWIWLAIYGKGGWQAEQDTLRNRMRHLAWQPTPDPQSE